MRPRQEPSCRRRRGRPDPGLLAADAAAACRRGAAASRPAGTVLPAVTCSVQATFLTGLPPAEHGIVGNGWYFRDLRRSAPVAPANALVAGEKLWDARAASRPRLHRSPTSAGGTRWAPTSDCASPRARSTPPTAARSPTATPGRRRCTTTLDRASSAPSRSSTSGARTPAIPSTAVDRRAAAASICDTHARPDARLPPAPRLRPPALRPRRRRAPRAPRESTPSLAPLLDDAARAGRDVVVAQRVRHHRRSAPGPHQPRAAPRGPAARCTPRRRAASTRGRSAPSRSATTRSPTSTSATPPTSRAVRERSWPTPRRRRVLDAAGKARVRPRPPALRRARRRRRAGRLVHLHYWLDDARAPDFARTGGHPPQARLRPGRALPRPASRRAQAARRAAGCAEEARHALPHGRHPARPLARPRQPRPAARRPRDGPVFLCSDASVKRDRFEATDVHDLLLGLATGGATTNP